MKSISEDDAFEAYVEEELLLDEAYFPDEEDWEDEDEFDEDEFPLTHLRNMTTKRKWVMTKVKSGKPKRRLCLL